MVQVSGLRVQGPRFKVRRACLQHVGKFRAEPELPHLVVEVIAPRLGAFLSSDFFLCSGIAFCCCPGKSLAQIENMSWLWVVLVMDANQKLL